jgi:hypothetical protein
VTIDDVVAIMEDMLRRPGTVSWAPRSIASATPKRPDRSGSYSTPPPYRSPMVSPATLRAAEARARRTDRTPTMRGAFLLARDDRYRVVHRRHLHPQGRPSLKSDVVNLWRN